MSVQWFFSPTVRHATAMRKHVLKVLNHQRDVLAPKAVQEIEAAMRQICDAIRAGANKEALEKQMENLEKVANDRLRTYPNSGWRENVEVLLVALSVAMGVRTFFLQPFKIPTGSMQPTLFGVMSTPDFSRINPRADTSDPQVADQIRARDRIVIPTGWQRVKDWFHGASYIHIKADRDGEYQGADDPIRFLIFNIYQRVHFAGQTYSIWFPPDYGQPKLDSRAGIHSGQQFHQGDDIIKMRVDAGDHLFVDRVTYNFRPPKRGEIVVFETRGIPEEQRQSVSPPIPVDQFYIKRLISLGGETLSIQKQYDASGVFGGNVVPVGKVAVNGQPVSAANPHFANLYSFNGAEPGSKVLKYEENHYFGHAMIGFLQIGRQFDVRDGYYFVMGDNTMNSQDSRYFGDFPAQYVIGRALFVYWPVTDRFGWSCLFH